MPLPKTLRVLLEELLGFVDLGGQVWTASSIGVVEQHESAVGFSDLVFRDGAFATPELVYAGGGFPFIKIGLT